MRCSAAPAAPSQSDEEIAPYRYGPPASPHLAAELAGEEIEPRAPARRCPRCGSGRRHPGLRGRRRPARPALPRLPGPRPRGRPGAAAGHRRIAGAGHDQPHAADDRGRACRRARGRSRRPHPLARASRAGSSSPIARRSQSLGGVPVETLPLLDLRRAWPPGRALALLGADDHVEARAVSSTSKPASRAIAAAASGSARRLLRQQQRPRHLAPHRLGHVGDGLALATLLGEGAHRQQRRLLRLPGRRVGGRAHVDDQARRARRASPRRAPRATRPTAGQSRRAVPWRRSGSRGSGPPGRTNPQRALAIRTRSVARRRAAAGSPARSRRS